MTEPSHVTPDTGSAKPTEPNHHAEPHRTDEPPGAVARVLRFVTRPRTSEPNQPAEPSRAGEPIRSVIAERASRSEAAEPSASAAPDANRRGFSYWLEEITGIVPLAAPLLIEAVIHARFAEHVIGLEQPFALLFPATIGLGAVRVAQFLDRARLREDPASLIRFGLYAYMAAGFGLSYWYLSTFDQSSGERLARGVDGDVLPAVIVGCAQAAGVFLWELRTRQRRREVDRAQHRLDADRLRRARMFPVWHWRMRRWAVATGVRDWSRVVEAFAPLILAQKAGQPHDRWPSLAEPVRVAPVVAEPPAVRPAPNRRAVRARTEPDVAEPARLDEPASAARSSRRGGLISADDLGLLVRVVAAFPNRETPSRRAIEPVVSVGSTVAGRLRRYYVDAAAGPWFDELLERAAELEPSQAAQ